MEKKPVSKNKTVIIVGIIIIVIVAVLIVSFALNNNRSKNLSKSGGDAITAITAEGIVKDEEYKGLKFTNITLMKDNQNDQYTLTMDVTNTNSEVSNIEQVFIPLKNKDGNTIVSLLGYIGEPLEPNETRTITASATIDLSKAVTKEITESNE